MKIIDIPEFVDREREKRELKAVLSGRPNLVYFVYGPINSGKTALLMKIAEELSDDYVVFYINFRWRDVEKVEDLVRVLFEVEYGKGREDFKEVVKEVLKAGAKGVGKIKGIPIPEKIFDYLFGSARKVEDIFKYLERVFELVVEENYKPVLILDEMQTIKEIVNTAGKPVISGLFNFLIGITKEKHLCHCLCATSDCLFVDLVYNSARLEGRAKYLLVDDLKKETAFRVYEEFGFEDKELVWEYIGGKIGDMVSLFEEKKRGYSEREALEMMLWSEVDKLDELLRRIKRVKKRVVFEGEEIEIEESGLRESLSVFKFEEEVRKDVIDIVYRNFLIEQNLLYYNPLTGTVRPQSRLLWRAIKEVMSGE